MHDLLLSGLMYVKVHHLVSSDVRVHSKKLAASQTSYRKVVIASTYSRVMLFIIMLKI
jgi:hypothetical protein